MNLDGYSVRAEAFTAELGREYYRHFAGLGGVLRVGEIYARHGELFTRAAVERLRALHEAAAPGTDAARRTRALLRFCVDGHVAQHTSGLEAERARREAELRLELPAASGGHDAIALSDAQRAQAGEGDPERRELIERARLHATRESLNPLAREILERQHELARELGWPSYRALVEELAGFDLGALGRRTVELTRATDDVYTQAMEAAARTTLGVEGAALRRCDIPRLLRHASDREDFPAQRLVAVFRATLHGLGIDLDRQHNVQLDLDPRAGKSSRAFCVPVRVPGEIYLVVAPRGGREDYVALLHEGGHAQHYAATDPALPFELRQLGDNSVTEAFAFLLDGLVADPRWLRRRLGIDDADGALANHVRVRRLLYLRRYAAKLSYELELHGGERPLEEMSAVYAGSLTRALGVRWPSETWLTDVDPGLYAANYLRAWGLEARLRHTLRERFGEAWFDEPAAGVLLRSLWREGQRLDAETLAAERLDGELDFGLLADEVAAAPI